MKDQESNDNWQLEEGNQVDDRWVLRESEQQLGGQWELNQAGEEEPIHDWQPVEYNRPERSGAAWILPVLITVFLLALIGYSGFILLPQIINPPDVSPGIVAGETPTPDPALAVVPDDDPLETELEDPDALEDGIPIVEVPPADAPDGDEPEATEPATQPSEPIAEPTPALPAIIEQDFATVITTYGVNSRAEPTADSEIVRVLNQAESFFLFGSPAEGWLEILVTDEDVELVQGEPIQGQVAYAASEFFDIAPQPIMRPFYEEIMAFAGRLPEEPVVDDEADEGDGALTGLPIPTPEPDGPVGEDEPAEPAAPEEITVRVESVAGLNVRSTPDTTGEIVGLLNEGDTAPALAVSDDETWIQVQLEDGVTGWVFAQFVAVDGDLSQIGASPPAPAAAPGVIDATQVVTSGVVPPAPYSAIIPGDTPAIVVAVAAGAIARVEPSGTAQELTLLPQGAALPALSRTADGQWIEIELPDGNLTGWVSRQVISVTSDINTLPVDGEPVEVDIDTDAPVLLPTPTPQPGGTTTTPATPAAPTTPGTASATATVRDILLSVYPEPNSDGSAIAMIPRSTLLPVSGRNESGDWILVETEAGDAGWVPARSVLLNVSVSTLPEVEP